MRIRINIHYPNTGNFPVVKRFEREIVWKLSFGILFFIPITQPNRPPSISHFNKETPYNNARYIMFTYKLRVYSNTQRQIMIEGFLWLTRWIYMVVVCLHFIIRAHDIWRREIPTSPPPIMYICILFFFLCVAFQTR